MNSLLVNFLTTGVRERTAIEFQELFAYDGFQLTNITPTSTSVCVIEGLKV